MIHLKAKEIKNQFFLTRIQTLWRTLRILQHMQHLASSRSVVFIFLFFSYVILLMHHNLERLWIHVRTGQFLLISAWRRELKVKESSRKKDRLKKRTYMYLRWMPKCNFSQATDFAMKWEIDFAFASVWESVFLDCMTQNF